jgi:hypothetical protein
VLLASKGGQAPAPRNVLVQSDSCCAGRTDPVRSWRRGDRRADLAGRLCSPQAYRNPVIDRLNAEIAAALGTDGLRTRLDGLMLQIEPSTPEELRERIAQESRTWEQFIRDHKLGPQ